jgi:hypothetical protein
MRRRQLQGHENGGLSGEPQRGQVLALLAGGGVVRVDVGRLDGRVAQQVIRRLRQTVPLVARLAVEGAPDPAHTVERLEAPRVLRARPS